MNLHLRKMIKEKKEVCDMFLRVQEIARVAGNFMSLANKWEIYG